MVFLARGSYTRAGRVADGVHYSPARSSDAPPSKSAWLGAKSAEIVRAVIGLGRALKSPVIAEGVETAGECSFLMLEGCEELQGYLIGRPAPAATYAMLINGDRANVLMAG